MFDIVSLLLSVIVVGLGGLFAFMWYWGRAAQQTLLRRIAELERQLAIVTQAVVPITLAFQKVLVQELTHYHTPIVDRLLEKLGPPFILTDDEEAELLCAMAAREVDMGDQITPSERDAARMLPLIIKRVKAEQFSSVSIPTMLQLVSVLTPAPEKPGGDISGRHP